VRASTTAEIAASEVSADDRRRAEAESMDVEWLIAPLRGDSIRVQPLMDWPRRIYDAAISRGDLTAIAEVIHEDDRDLWANGDATVRDSFRWLEQVARASGQDVGESGASSRF
jgi:hypothetical protein